MFDKIPDRRLPASRSEIFLCDSRRVEAQDTLLRHVVRGLSIEVVFRVTSLVWTVIKQRP